MKDKNSNKEKSYPSSNIPSGFVRDLTESQYMSKKQKRREYGAHLTSTEIFKKYIFPEIKDFIQKYAWVDLFAGEGNLILPILEYIEEEKRIAFFSEHIFLYDIQTEMINKCLIKAEKYGIPLEIAKKNIKIRDT